jgi:hypothetical protein
MVQISPFATTGIRSRARTSPRGFQYAGGPITLSLRACVDSDPVSAAFCRALGVYMNRLDIVPPQPHFRTDGVARRHRCAHCGDDLANAVRVLQERGAAVMAIDRSRRATKIQVHCTGAGPNGDQGGLGQQASIAAQKLHLNRQSRGGSASVHQFGNAPLEDPRARNGLADPQKLRHAESEAAEFR